jgi:hypothetical protein
VNYRRAWGRFVAEQLCVVNPVGRGDVVEIWATAGYAAALTAPFQYLGAQVVHREDAGERNSRGDLR